MSRTFKTHNVNNYVKAKLTQRGKEIYEQHYSRFGNSKIELKTDKDGYSSFQMHTFMNIFGEHMLLGYEVPFETEVFIEISEKEDDSNEKAI